MLRIEGDFNKIFSDCPAGSIASAVFAELNLAGEVSVELVLTSKQKIRKINLEQRGIDKVTDVLSFPYIDKILPFTDKNYPHQTENGAILAGSVVICKARANEQAKKFGHSYNRELSYLLTHGLLHIFGYDHINDNDKKQMRKTEEQILSKIGLAVSGCGGENDG